MEQQNSDEHTKRTQALTQLDTLTREAFAEKAKLAASKKQQEEATRTAAQQEQQAGPPVDPAAAALQELERAKAAFEQQLKDLRAQQEAQLAAMKETLNAQLQADQERQRKAHEFKAMTLAFEATAKVTVDELPTLTAPSGSQLQHQGQLYQLLAAWAAAGAVTPFSFQDLINHTSMAADAPLFVRTALGSKWSMWFSTDPGAHALIPRQVGQLLLQSLEKLKAQWQGDTSREQIAKQGEDSYAAVAGEAKKRRAELLDQEMIPAE